jgi:hypothetical protein
LKDQWVIKEIKKFPESNENKNRSLPEAVGCNKSTLKKKFYSHEYPHQKIREVPNNLMMYFKLLEKQEQANLEGRDQRNNSVNQ